ncbi:Adhesion G-protein coupled receptor G1 [Labeo rohita]|uniref:Adhesion G-protein coupled receptor G1 n=1 Tax=Labeo rohita TaxID=84645 RepID=A0ABQ8N085_LABRO|nr:Adhesion G-protein coupled receptor G1 [Labeo rohita]
MFRASVQLLIGVCVVFAVDNETTTMITSTEYTTVPVSKLTDSTTLNKTEESPKNVTTPSSNVTLSTTMDVNNTQDEKSAAYIIILVIVMLCLAGVAVYFCCQKKSRKYSVDLHPKQEDAQIPLSTVDVEVFDTTSVKESADVQQENQQNVSSTQATVNPKDKMDGLTVVDLTDGEPTISTKTSMESLDDTLNENNSNNTEAEGNGNGHEFTEISTDALLLK